MPQRAISASTSLEQSVTQLLLAAENDFNLSYIIHGYRKIIEKNHSFVRALVLRSIYTLSAELNRDTLQISRMKLSRILNFAEQLFPNANLSEWLWNPGKAISDNSLPLGLCERVHRDPELRSQLPYAIELTSAGLWQLGQIANTYYKADALNQKSFIVYHETLEEILAHSIFKIKNPYEENYFLIQGNNALGGLHFTILVTKWENGIVHIGVLDSLGFDVTKQNPTFSNIYLNTIVQMAQSCRVRVNVYVTPTKRQFDLISSAQFVLNDFFTFKDSGFFNYVHELKTERGELVTHLGWENEYCSVQIIREHPSMLLPMQSQAVLRILQQNGLVERYFRNSAQFYKDLEVRFWQLGGSGENEVNVQTQVDLFHLVRLLLEHKIK